MKIIVFVGLFSILGWIVSVAQGTNESSARIEGRVVDLLGTPLKGAQVTLRFDEKRVFETRSDANGEYLLSSLPSGNANFFVSEIGFYVYKTNIYVSPGERAIFDVGLRVGRVTDGPNLVVQGSVRSASATPIENATVVARSAFSSEVVVFSRSSKTGAFRLQLPSYGEYLVYATYPRKQIDLRLLNIDAEKAYVADFILRPVRDKP